MFKGEEMKKVGLIIGGIIVLIGAVTAILLSTNNYSHDEKEFKKEYEKFNHKKTKDGKEYLTLNIPKKNNIQYKSAKEIISALQKDTAVIFFGFPECPWCRNLVPILLESIEENDYPNFYYYNALAIRDQKHLDEDGNIVVDKESTAEYKKIVELLGDFLGEYEGLNDPSIKRLYFPTVVFVSDGEIKGVHIGTLDEHKDPYKKLTAKQKKKIKKLFQENISKIEEKVCTGVNKC